jgi:hypothetical protein
MIALVLITHVNVDHVLIDFVLLGLNLKRIERKLLIQRTELVLILISRNFFIALGWAAEPTRDTEIPTLIAGRIPELKYPQIRKFAHR